MAQDPKQPRRPRVSRPGARVAAVVSRYHEELTGAMWASARRELEAAGVTDLREVWVPGAFELPLVARRLARRGDVDAVLCFGLVLKGETRHDEVVAHGAVEGIVRASLETDVPILLGVLTCATLAQARARALPPERGGEQDKGREVALAALETLAALDEADRGGRPAGHRAAGSGSSEAAVRPSAAAPPHEESLP